MNIELCIEKVKSDFSFLLREHSFELAHIQKENWGFELMFKSETVGIIVCFEYREFYLFVEISRLIEGAFPDSPGEITPETILNGFYLGDIINIRAPEKMISAHKKDTSFNMNLFNKISEKQSSNLKNYCTDIILGDFSIFKRLDKVIKKRARIFAFEKWGDEAVKFGWKKEEE